MFQLSPATGILGINNVCGVSLPLVYLICTSDMICLKSLQNVSNERPRNAGYNLGLRGQTAELVLNTIKSLHDTSNASKLIMYSIYLLSQNGNATKLPLDSTDVWFLISCSIRTGGTV